MSKGRKPIPPAPPTDDEAFEAKFVPVPTRRRHDGWNPDKQVSFIEALAESGCVDHAARAVGMNPASAYRLRARSDAASFRAAWDFALEFAVSRLAHATLSRAIHGVSRPVFYKGEQIGERRYYDERLAMFILRMRDPVNYGAWIDRLDSAERHPEAPAVGLMRALNRLSDGAWAEQLGSPKPSAPIVFPQRHCMTDADRKAHQAELDRLRAELDRLGELLSEEETRADNAEKALARICGRGG